MYHQIEICNGLFHFIGIHPPLRRDNYIQGGYFEQFNEFLVGPFGNLIGSIGPYW